MHKRYNGCALQVAFFWGGWGRGDGKYGLRKNEFLYEHAAYFYNYQFSSVVYDYACTKKYNFCELRNFVELPQRQRYEDAEYTGQDDFKRRRVVVIHRRWFHRLHIWSRRWGGCRGARKVGQAVKNKIFDEWLR